MSDVSYRELSLNGLWKNNPAIVQLLGLCPLLAVTGTVVNAIGLAAASAAAINHGPRAPAHKPYPPSASGARRMRDGVVPLAAAFSGGPLPCYPRRS